MTDEAIIEKVLDGNTHIFSEIVKKYKDGIFGMIYGITGDYGESQDISQEIFVKVFENLHLYDAKAKFSTWLYRVGYNFCTDWCRKNKKRKANVFIGDGEYDAVDERHNVEENYISKQRHRDIRNAVNTLKEKYRITLILYHFQGLSYEEIGEVLKIPLRTVETRLYRGRDLLKRELSEKRYGGEFYEMPQNTQDNLQIP